MKTNKIIGLIIFGIGAAYLVIIGVGGGWLGASPAFHLSPEELNQTAWRLGSPLMMFWAFNGWLGPILAGVGILLYVKAKGTHILLFGIGLFIWIISLHRLFM